MRGEYGGLVERKCPECPEKRGEPLPVLPLHHRFYIKWAAISEHVTPSYFLSKF